MCIYDNGGKNENEKDESKCMGLPVLATDLVKQSGVFLFRLDGVLSQWRVTPAFSKELQGCST